MTRGIGRREGDAWRHDPVNRVSGPFTPASLSGLVLWLRSDLGITLTGSKVSAWADQSGAGNDFAQGTDAWRPVYTASNASMGNKPSLDFTAAMIGLTRADLFLGFGAASVSITYRKAIEAGAPRAFGPVTAAGGTFQMVCNSGTGFDVTQVNTGTNTRRSTPDGINVNFNRIGVVPIATAGAVDPIVYSQGVAGGSVTSSTSVDGVVGTGTWNIGYLFDASVVEIIGYNRLITAGEAAQIYAYQLARYA